MLNGEIVKNCDKCGQSKPLDAFVKDNRKPDGRRIRCKACTQARIKYRLCNEPEFRAKHKQSRIESKERKAINKKSRMKRIYGISHEEYDRLSQLQNHRCAICNETDAKGECLAIDHCHSTKRVRGLLCKRCNLGLGNFRDNPDTLRHAIIYLEKFQQSIFPHIPVQL